MARTFGVEIEYAGSIDEVTYALRNTVDITSEYDYDEGWVSKTDGSVYNGGEVASRILDFDLASDRREVSDVLRKMRDVGCAPSEQAGIHVHVGTHGLTPEQIAGVAYGFIRLEDFYYRLASSGWDHMRENARSYAHPISREAKAMMIAGDFTPDAVFEVAANDRYFGINFGNAYSGRRTGRFQVNEQGTLEFRIWNSTMNPERLQAFIAASVGLVKAAELGRLGTPRLNRYNCYPLGGMAGGWRSEAAVVNAAMRVLSSGGRVLSATDRRRILRFFRSAAPQENVFGAMYQLPGWVGPDTVRGGAEPPVVRTGWQWDANVERDDAHAAENQLEDPEDYFSCAYCGDDTHWDNSIYNGEYGDICTRCNNELEAEADF